MSTDTLQRINALIEQAAIEAAEAERERLMGDTAARMAYDQGRVDERGRLLNLISIQMDTLQRGGINALSLSTLRNSVLAIDS